MNLIDDIVYNGRKEYTKEEILQAYKILFKTDSIPARIVLQDLIAKISYNSKVVSSDSNIFYHQKGMDAVIDFIRDGINTPILDEEQIQKSVE